MSDIISIVYVVDVYILVKVKVVNTVFINGYKFGSVIKYECVLVVKIAVCSYNNDNILINNFACNVV